jgi:hypothetical protein
MAWSCLAVSTKVDIPRQRVRSKITKSTESGAQAIQPPKTLEGREESIQSGGGWTGVAYW